MKTIDYLKPDNKVTVTVDGPEGTSLYEATSSGYRSIEEALKATFDEARLEIDPEDCVFKVTNDDTGVSHKYRLNAHGNLKLIV